MINLPTTDFVIHMYCPKCGKLIDASEESRIYTRQMSINISDGFLIITGCDLKMDCSCGFKWRQDKPLELKSRVKIFPKLEVKK